MPRETREAYFGAMMALSAQLPEGLTFQEACLNLADFISRNESKIGHKGTQKLLVLGAGMWRRAVELGEDWLDIHHVPNDD